MHTLIGFSFHPIASRWGVLFSTNAKNAQVQKSVIFAL